MKSKMMKTLFGVGMATLLQAGAARAVTAVNENFEGQPGGDPQNGTVGMTGTWLTNQYINGRVPYWDGTNPSPDQDWQPNVYTSAGNKLGAFRNVTRGVYPDVQSYDLDGFIKFATPAAAGKEVHGIIRFDLYDGIPAFGLASDIQALANATATHAAPNAGGSDEGVATGSGAGAAASIPSQMISLFTMNPGFGGRLFGTYDSAGTHIALNQDFVGHFAGTPNTLEFYYKIGSNSFEYVKLNGTNVFTQIGGNPVPVTNPGSFIDGIFFTDTGKKGTQFDYDNIFIEVIPEPSTALLFGCGALIFWWRRRS